MSDPLVFFGSLQLADLMVAPEKMRVPHDEPTFRGATGAARSHTGYPGANARFETVVRIAFQRQSAESERTFWHRVRTFQIALVNFLVNTPNALSFVRDPDGDEWAQDETSNNGAITGSGSPQAVTLANVDADWTNGDYVLVIDAAAPTTTYELAQISSVVPGTDGSVTVTLANSYQAGSRFLRLRWHQPGVALLGTVELQGSGELDSNDFFEFEMTFAGTEDPVNGAAT